MPGKSLQSPPCARYAVVFPDMTGVDSMKKFVLLMAMMTVVAACNSSQDEAGETAIGPDQSKAAAIKPALASKEKGVDVLTSLGFKPEFAYTVVYDINDKNDAGVNRHRVLLEVLEGDIDTAMTSASATLASAGYGKSRETESNGRRDVVFTKQGFPTLVFMAQTPERGPALKTPGAVGTIHVMWNFY
jgi:hypothetical protein